MPNWQTRRRFLGGLSLAGATSLAGMSLALAAEGPPEVTRLRLLKLYPGVCIAPQYVAEPLLRAEGFTQIEYGLSQSGAPAAAAVAGGTADFSLNYAGPNIIAVDAGEPLVMLAGVHVGCFELFGHRGVRSIADLKDKQVGVLALGSSQHVYLEAMLAYIGVDPRKDVTWITGSASAKPIELFADGKVDAYLGFAPEPQDLRTRRIGHVVVDSAVDRPWAQYFCCMLSSNHEFVRKYPVATKRVLRAILKAADFCAAEPAQAARAIVDRGFTSSYPYALDALSKLPYNLWREWDPGDTLRFYALRLREAGLIKSSPQKILDDGADWRFLDAVKRELKA